MTTGTMSTVMGPGSVLGMKTLPLAAWLRLRHSSVLKKETRRPPSWGEPLLRGWKIAV